MILECIRKCAFLVLGVLPPAVFAAPVVIGFDSLSDGTFVTTQFPGVTLSNAIVLTSGISLNELDFPPFSGLNVVSDSGGAISLVFAVPVLSFSGFFTYVVPVTIQGFSSSNVLLGSASSLAANNTLTGGDPGSSANELIQISSATGITRVVITGVPSGGSFALDDATYSAEELSGVPEPASVACVLTGLTVLLAAAKARGRC